MRLRASLRPSGLVRLLAAPTWRPRHLAVGFLPFVGLLPIRRHRHQPDPHHRPPAVSLFGALAAFDAASGMSSSRGSGVVDPPLSNVATVALL
jgi:hypothetical protein